MTNVSIIVLDFGSQYTQLIARRLREDKIYCEILPYYTKVEEIKAKNPQGIILSGGPSSVYNKDAYEVDQGVYSMGIPVLGICYGMQRIAADFGGSVIRSSHHEYGKAELKILDLDANCSPLFKDCDDERIVWATAIKSMCSPKDSHLSQHLQTLRMQRSPMKRNVSMRCNTILKYNTPKRGI